MYTVAAVQFDQFWKSGQSEDKIKGSIKSYRIWSVRQGTCIVHSWLSSHKYTVIVYTHKYGSQVIPKHKT